MTLSKQQIFMMYFACGYKKIFVENKQIEMSGIKTMPDRDVIHCSFNPSDLRSKYTDYCKLILREFSDITEGEIKTYTSTRFDANRTIYLLSSGIDLFDAIQQGYAINAKDVI